MEIFLLLVGLFLGWFIGFILGIDYEVKFGSGEKQSFDKAARILIKKVKELKELQGVLANEGDPEAQELIKRRIDKFCEENF